MARTAQEVLEFDKLRELLRLRTTCAPGRRLVDALEPVTNRTALESAFALFREEAARFPLLAARAASISDFREVHAAIRRCLLPNGEISDDASTALGRIRTSITQTREAIQKTLKQILRARNAEAGEDYVTLRNERFVIPVRTENRRSVHGVVHGASATGQTVFMEPFETVEANNQLVQLAEDEAEEIARILRELTERLQAIRGPLQSAAATIAELDSVFARARFARDFDAAVPEFSNADRLHLEDARHPVLEDKLKRENRVIVPMSLSLGGEERVLVISGPNTGGKTVALKTVGVAALAAQAGIPVAAQRAILPIFDRVLVDIGDEQSIAADLSTFSAHMLNLKSMLDRLTPQSLVLVDEMGTGTAPEEGAALAVALLDEFRAKNCIVLATTHHDRLKTYASTTPGVVNAAVEFDDVKLRPTYRLMVGVPGGSSGIAIARRLGMAAGIIERARSLLTPESREAADLIAYLHRSRDELDRIQREMNTERRAREGERKELRTEWVERQQKRIRELEAQFDEMQKRFDENVARVVEGVKERELRAQLEQSTRRKMQDVRSTAREELNAAAVQTISESQADLGTHSPSLQAVSADRLQAGAKIRVRGFSKPVVFRRLDGSSAEIEAGPLRMKVAVDEITGVESPDAKAVSKTAAGAVPRLSGVTVHAHSRESPAADEINVIGMTVEEATDRLDKFLDDAALRHKPRVRIIHGHGTGALRKGIGAFLDGHPLVEKHSFESEEHGGKAITIVELQK